MSGFNENSVANDRPMGQEEGQQPAANRLAAPITNPEPSVRSTEPGLAWWDAMKYFWKRNASGRGSHLAPQDSYTADVIDRSNVYVERAASDLSTDDLETLDRVNGLVTELVQEFAAIDETEAKAFRRYFLSRAAIARKIAGQTAVSAEHRLINAYDTGKSEADIEAMKADTSSTGYYCADIEKRNSWAHKTCVYEYLSEKQADGDAIPRTPQEFVAKQEKTITRQLYDGAVEQGNKLKRPVQNQPAGQATSGPSREELLAMTA